MIKPEETHLVVSSDRQTVELVREGVVTWSASVSTAAKGLGEEEGSHQTPRGWFSICEKIGDGAPWGSIFKSRQATGGVWSLQDPETSNDLILTRILWLEGLETPNLNTKKRYIYFHGTNQEGLIGQPASHGCIRLKNDQMIELFEMVDVGTKVNIY